MQYNAKLQNIASDIYFILAELLDEIQREGLAPKGFVLEELAECLFIKNSHDEAKEYFRKAYEILSKDIWLKANAGDRLHRLRELGE